MDVILASDESRCPDQAEGGGGASGGLGHCGHSDTHSVYVIHEGLYQRSYEVCIVCKVRTLLSSLIAVLVLLLTVRL